MHTDPPSSPTQRDTTRSALRSLLRCIGSGGLMGVTASAPSALTALEQCGAFDDGTPHSMRQRLLAEVRRQELVVTSRDGEILRLQLTVKGIHRLQRAEIDELAITAPAQWDKKWRMVVFDIPTAHKQQRYIFVSQLRRLGFKMVRHSTWYHPYPCFDVIDTLIRYCAFSSYVTLAEISRLDSATTRKLMRAFPGLTN